MSRREWRSLLFLFSLAVLGHLIRAVLVVPGASPGAVELFDRQSDGDPLAQAALVARLMSPVAAGERIDIDRASAAELRRLPGVGAALAARIVADRQSKGPFGSLAGLDRVPGVGPATLTRLAPMLQFGGVPADISGVGGPTSEVDLNQASVSQLDALPGIGLVRAQAIVAFRDSQGPFRDIADLAKIPGLSPALIERLSGRLVVR